MVALIRGKQLIVANAGDSRCVVSEAGKALDMSYDHKPEDEVELARIKNAGGKVTMDGRVNGGLNLSRAIGKCQETMGKTSGVLFSVLVDYSKLQSSEPFYFSNYYCIYCLCPLNISVK